MSGGDVEDWVAGLLAPDASDAPDALEAAEAPAAAQAEVAPSPAAVPATAPEPAIAPAPARAVTPPASTEGEKSMNAVAEKTETDEAPRRYVTFRIARETYALDVLRVREVLRSAEVVPVPGAPDSVLGVINLRGSIVPVVDARHRLGLEPAPPDTPSRVLIMESGWQAVGLRVDSVADVTTVTPDECEAPPPMGHGEQSRCLRGVVRRDDEFMILVDVDDLLPRTREVTAEPLR